MVRRLATTVSILSSGMTIYRAYMTLITLLAILAVDFGIGSRALAKCEGWGVELVRPSYPSSSPSYANSACCADGLDHCLGEYLSVAAFQYHAHRRINIVVLGLAMNTPTSPSTNDIAYFDRGAEASPPIEPDSA